MKTSIKTLVSLFFLFTLISEARADIIQLKNGHQMQGIIKKETDEFVELEINLGTVKFYRGQIERVEYSSQDERRAMEESWKEGRLKKEAEARSRQEKTEASRQEKTEARPNEIAAIHEGNHLFVNVLLNKKVKAKLLIDTGASFVVLSADIAKQLNISIKEKDPEVKMILADGGEASGKMFKLDTISVGEVKADDVQAAVIYQENAFKNFDGLLGMSFLKLFKFEVNLDKGKLILQKS